MQHRDMLPFLITSVIENEGNGKSTFFVSVSKNAKDGIFRGSNYTPYHFERPSSPPAFPLSHRNPSPHPKTGPNPPKTHTNVLLDNAIIHA